MVDLGAGAATPNRFVCPNDRQLALRAKLRTGWSMKTANFGFQSQPPPNTQLEPEEQAAIVEVIQRAEKVDLTEQERVGRLVERLENMRRNALGKNGSQCLLCGDSFGMLGAQKVVCMDCRRLACQKCAIESGKTPTHSKDHHWLCMICAETREMWKKSGAWFFKSLPKYVLPNEDSFSRNRSVRMSRSGTGRGFRDDDSSSEDERKLSNKIGKIQHHRRNSSTENMQDRESPMPSRASSGEAQMAKELEPLRNYMSSMTLSEEVDMSSLTSSEISRRESIASRSTLDCNWSDSRSEEFKISPGSSSSFIKEDKLLENSMGIIELSMNFDQVTSTLHCTIYRAKNLIPMDIQGLSDPFCKVNVVPNGKASTRLRTKTVHKTRNPEFNENLTFYDITESELLKKFVHILVVDDDKYGHDYMGETKISLAKLKVQNTIYLSAPLENLRIELKGFLPALELNQWFDDLWSRGQILLSLCYSTKKRALIVTVVRCTNLLPMDNNGFSDPFIKLQLRPDPCHRKHKTSIKWKNLNPVYNEEFAFETRPTELYTQNLYITAFDKDYGKSNDYLGGLILGGNGSKGRRLKHWLDMIRYPDHRHEAWHNLTEEVLD